MEEIKNLFHIWISLFGDWSSICNIFIQVIDPDALRPVSRDPRKVIGDAYDHMRF